MVMAITTARLPHHSSGATCRRKAIAATFDAGHIHEQIQRIEASIDADPTLAIGTAKELVESCFKTILGERGIEYGGGDDVLDLGKKDSKPLSWCAMMCRRLPKALKWSSVC